MKENENICGRKKSEREERSLEGKKEVWKGRRKYGREEGSME